MRRKVQTLLTQQELSGLVNLREVFHERGEILLVLELMNGDLNRLKLDSKDVLEVLYDLLETLSALHKKGIVHFDVRPGENN